MRHAVLLLLLLAPQGTKPTARVTTSYTLVGQASADTAAATREFVAALGEGMRVLPPVARRAQGADTKVEAAEYGVMLSIMGSSGNIRLQARAVDVKSGRVQVTETSKTSTADSIGIVARDLGRTVARALRK